MQILKRNNFDLGDVHMYKKGFILLFVAILTLSLAACGKSDSDQSSNHKGKLEIKRL